MDNLAIGSLLMGKCPTSVVVVPPPTEIVPYKIPAGIIDCVLANPYAGDRHPSEHSLYLSQLCSLFKLAGVSTEFVMKKLFSVSLIDKASDWYKLLDNSHLLDWHELMSLFYTKFYPAILKHNLPVEPLGILSQPKEDPVFDLKPLPDKLKYAYLDEKKVYPV